MNRTAIDKIVARMEASPANVDFKDLMKVCEFHFGLARRQGTSHAVFATPWSGDPRVNIQNDHGKAKPYQVHQVLKALARLEQER